MGFVSVPVAVFLYWLMLHKKKDEPFPKGGLLLLLLAGAASAILASLLNPLISVIIEGDAEITEPTFMQNLIHMFFCAGLLEECLKFLMCRVATKKDGILRTWMDSVISFATVGITFGVIENIVYGMNGGLAAAVARALTPGHFVFGVIMGYFYGKYRVSGQKKYLLLCLIVPIVIHTITNAFYESVSLSNTLKIMAIASGVFFIIATIVEVCLVIRWQKNKTLDIPIEQNV